MCGNTVWVSRPQDPEGGRFTPSGEEPRALLRRSLLPGVGEVMVEVRMETGEIEVVKEKVEKLGKEAVVGRNGSGGGGL